MKDFRSKRFRPLNTGLAHLDIATYNIRSLSPLDGNSGKDTRKRHADAMSHVQRLLEVAPALLLQETNLPRKNRILQNSLPDHTVFDNPLKRGTSGTATILHNSLLKYYDITNHNPVKGLVQMTTLTPLKTEGELSNNKDTIVLVNIYIPKPEKRKTVFDVINDIQVGTKILMGGDFNFVEEADDAPSGTSSVILSGERKEEWDALLIKFGLREMKQGIHTHYTLSTNTAHASTSRIDRIYITANDTDNTITRPYTYIPHLPSTPLSLAKNGERDNLSDHLPVALKFLGAPSKNKTGPHERPLPKWIGDDEDVIRLIENKWNPCTSKSPFKELRKFCRIVRDSVAQILKSGKRRKAANLDSHQQVSDCIKLYKMLTHHKPHNEYIQTFVQTHPHLKGVINPNSNLKENASLVHNRLIELQSGIAGNTKEILSDDPLPLSTKPPASHKCNMLESLSNSLPSTRNRLLALRESPDTPPTSDPTSMARLLEHYWEGIWGPRPNKPSKEERRDYLLSYTKRVPPELIPTIPSIDDIRDIINGSENSSPGPDGIPFAILRSFSKQLAPILHNIITLLGKGIKPPKWFNSGKVIFLPKKGTLMAGDTRPITISNTIYRVLAKVVVISITPCLQNFLSPSQKGFLPGRDGRDHIHDLANTFYHALENDEKLLVLFLDTKKAFDSIDHEFLLEVLKTIGLGGWVCNLVGGLLHEVVATPDLHGAQPIPIKRGVKQGCPLSPLLFILAYDVLLHRIEATSPSTTPFGYADDLAITSPDMSGVIKVLSLIRNYSKNSGLGVNWDKSSVLPSSPLSSEALGLLRLSGYSEIQITERALYLGVLIGTNITTRDIFQVAVEKYIKRVHHYRPAILARSLHQRIMIFNIFINPILYYLSQFYLLPNIGVITTLRNIAHKHIVAFNGTSIAYSHIIARPPDLGPKTPLVDLWAWNIALLAQDFPLSKSHQRYTPWVPDGMEHVLNITTWESLQVKEHKAHAAIIYLTYGVDWDAEGRIDTSRIPDIPRKTRRIIYDDCVREALVYKRSRYEASDRYKTSLPNKVVKHSNGSIPLDEANKLVSHIAQHTKIKNKIRPSIWNTFFRFFMRALPFARRTRFFLPGYDPDNPPPCLLCEEGEDSHTHTYQDCQVVAEAFKRVADATGFTPFEGKLNLHSLLLLFPASSPTFTMMVVTFVWGVWRAREEGPYTSLVKATTSITTRTLQTLIEHGAQTSCNHAQHKINNLAHNPPANCLAIFTDGSSLNGQTSCGAGLHISRLGESSDSPPLHINIALALGTQDNNFGEMVALLVAGMIADKHRLSYPTDSIIIFSDSLISLGYINGTWPTPTLKELAQSTRRRFDTALEDNRTRLYWIKGHDKITGNELADKQAKIGAKLNDDPLPPISISHDQDQLGNIQHISHNLYESISELVEPYLA